MRTFLSDNVRKFHQKRGPDPGFEIRKKINPGSGSATHKVTTVGTLLPHNYMDSQLFYDVIEYNATTPPAHVTLPS
jgi:hypothetical protein